MIQVRHQLAESDLVNISCGRNTSMAYDPTEKVVMRFNISDMQLFRL